MIMLNIHTLDKQWVVVYFAFFFKHYELCKLHPKNTLHDPFLTVFFDSVSLASYFLSYLTKVIIKKDFCKCPH